MKHPIPSRTRLADGYLDFMGEAFDEGFIGVPIAAYVIAIIVGLCGIGQFPLAAILACTLAWVPWVVFTITMVCMESGREKEFNKKISESYNKSQLCSDAARDTAEQIVKEIVRISNRKAPDDIKHSTINKRIKSLDALVDADNRLHAELARQSIDDDGLDHVTSVIQSINETTKELVARRTQ